MMNKKFKIAIINSVYRYGSTGRICFELNEFLQKSGFETRVFFGRKMKVKQTEKNVTNFSLPFSVPIHALSSRILDNSGFCSFFSTKKLVKMLSKFKPDLIISHNLHGYYLDIKILLKWIANSETKSIFVFHDCWNFTGHCAHFANKKCEKWKTQCYRCPCKNEYPSSVLFDNSKRNYLLKKSLFSKIKDGVIVTPSIWMSNLVKESFFKKNDIRVINNGIDTKIFHKTNIYFEDNKQFSDKKIILCVASVFNEKKGLNDILSLGKLISDDFQIIIVGKINPNIPLIDSIYHIDRLNSPEELAMLYSSAFVFFNPTYDDNYPTVNLEALCCGCPVISYKTGGSCEMIDQRFAVEKGDYIGAFEMMQKMANGELNYSFQDDILFSKQVMLTNYLNLIKELLCIKK